MEGVTKSPGAAVSKAPDETKFPGGTIAPAEVPLRDGRTTVRVLADRYLCE